MIRQPSLTAAMRRRAPNILLITGTSSLGDLRDSLATSGLDLPDQAEAALAGIAAP